VEQDFVKRPQLSLATALKLVEAAVGHASSVGVPIAVAVTDAAGNVIASARMDDAPLGAARLAIDKAYTSVLWQMPSGELRESSQPGGDDWGITATEGGRVVVYAGGFPLFYGGQLAGAIGVSGGTGKQDADCAREAIGLVLPDSTGEPGIGPV
jgi:uncharacterized protein GlcG (DUF336 family)